ncbi:MAG: nucleotide-binding protein [Clostridia bacterium]|nr:nucleotide-binding protein [Clostridia bacterium]
MKIFIGSSSEQELTVYKVQEKINEINREYCTLLWCNIFHASEYTMESLVRVSKKVNCAIFIFSGDDKVSNKRGEFLKTRDNVILEYGFFSGALGIKNVVIICKDKVEIPTDLKGITYIAMNQDFESRLRAWLNNVSKERGKFDKIAIDANRCKGVKILESDLDGYFSAIIEEIRPLSKDDRNFTAYKLNGLVTNYYNNKINIVEGESHWLFYEDGRFEKLSEKDNVKFKIEKIDSLKTYKKGEKSRNIYVEYVEKL